MPEYTCKITAKAGNQGTESKHGTIVLFSEEIDMIVDQQGGGSKEKENMRKMFYLQMRQSMFCRQF